MTKFWVCKNNSKTLSSRSIKKTKTYGKNSRILQVCISSMKGRLNSWTKYYWFFHLKNIVHISDENLQLMNSLQKLQDQYNAKETDYKRIDA